MVSIRIQLLSATHLEQPANTTLPDVAMTVGMDGDFGRAAHKEGWFEVIAGKSVVSIPPRGSWRNAFVQVLWICPLKSQGMQENQQVVFLSDGGDIVRQLLEYLHACCALDRLVPYHDAAESPPTASERLTDRTASVGPGNIKTARKR